MPVKKFYEFMKDRWSKSSPSVQAPQNDHTRFLLTYNNLLLEL